MGSEEPRPGSPRAALARLLVALALATTLGGAVAAAAPGRVSEQQLGAIQLPPGFRINVYAEGLGYARMMAFNGQGGLLVTAPSQDLAGDTCNGGGCARNAGRVYLLPDRDRDGVADRTVVLADGLDRPHGIAYHEGAIYVAEHGRVVRLPDRQEPIAPSDVEVVVADLPINPGSSHWTRTLAFGLDGKLYVSAGSNCNVCEVPDERLATVLVHEADGSGQRIFARGLRNAVGLAVDPRSGTLWASINMRDLVGDDFPPELLTEVRDGDHFGWPFCNAGTPDPDFGHLGDCTQTRPPTLFLPAHSAPLGMAFYTGQQFPAEYRGDLFVALHGSWNRSRPQGYKVVRVPMTHGMAGLAQDFASGWLPAEANCNNRPADAERNTGICRADVWGRPVALAVGPDGAMYLSDDTSGVIYRITYAP